MSKVEMREPVRTVNDTVYEVRNVMTLFVKVGGQELTRTFESPWYKHGEPAVDPNRMHRDVVQAFRDLCRTWGIAEAEGVIVSENEERKTQEVTEVTSSLEEFIRKPVSYDKVDEEAAAKGQD